MNLYERLSLVDSTNPYFEKDLKKAKQSNCFIGRGSVASSTNKYMVAAGELANKGSYLQTDVVFVSAEGNRRGRVVINKEELSKAISAGASFVTDKEYDRNRPYNVGEREVASFLMENSYQEENGVWKQKG